MPYDPQESLPGMGDPQPGDDDLRWLHSVQRRDWRRPTVAEFAKVNPMSLEETARALGCMGSSPPFAWREIDPWIGREGRRGMKCGSSPAYRCPFCEQKMVWMYWENDTPPEALCGCGGPIEVCLGCRWWGRFQMCWLS